MYLLSFVLHVSTPIKVITRHQQNHSRDKNSRLRFYRFAIVACIRAETCSTYLLTHSMEQSPSWEGIRFSASQEIPRIVWNPKFHYRIHTCPPPVPILSQLDPVHSPTSHFLKIHLYIIFQSTPVSPKWSLSLRFPNHIPVYASSLPHTCYMPRPSHSRFYHRTTLDETTDN